MAITIAAVGGNPAGNLSITAGATFTGTLNSFNIILFADGVYAGTFLVSDDPDFTDANPNFDIALASVDGLAEQLGEINQFFLTAEYEVPGLTVTDPVTVTYSVTETAEISIASTAQNLAGTAGADLLLGSDLADTIDGGAGADVILGFTGNDSLDGGVGDDFISFSGSAAVGLNGGTGRDVLSLMFDGTVDLQALNATSIEAIDLTNTTAQNLEMSLADLIAIFDTGDIDLNAVLDVDATSLTYDPLTTLTILGDTSDSVNITGLNMDQYFQETGNTVQTETGETLSIWQIVDYSGVGDVLATLGIDTDVAVVGGGGLS